MARSDLSGKDGNMRIVTGNVPRVGGRVVVLGTFDGVHRGHQELIRQGIQLAKTLGVPLRVCTFDRHPLEVIRPEKAPLLLTTTEEKTERMRACGVEELRVIPFDLETARTQPEDFLLSLRMEQKVKAVVAGWNYTFGCAGRGTSEMLQEDGKQNGYRVLIVPPVQTEKGDIISSSAIRDRLLCGDFSGATEMLGGEYTLSGPIGDGKHLGRKIGVPTANLKVPGRKLIPAFGVYAGRLTCGGQSWMAAVNIGVQPTAPSGQVTIEAHVLDAEPDLYGKQAKLQLLQFLRPEIRFDSVKALSEQIQRDIQSIREVF